MINYRGYRIKKVENYDFYEITNPLDKWFKNALTVEEAKKKINMVENSRY